MLTVSVCVCTFRRDHLSATLQSLLRQDDVDDIHVQIVVADNDSVPSAKPQVDALNAGDGGRIAYVHAPFNNISLARNACLDAAHGEMIAFMDDDELADPRWLHNMIDFLRKANADVVFGPVQAVYPSDAPDWLKRSSPHSLRPPMRGGNITTGYTANVLIRKSVIKQHRFDLACGLTGGEDTDFFNRLYRDGAKLGFCADGLLVEAVAPERLSLRWLLRRSYRSGHSHARFVLRHGKLVLFLTAFCKVVIFAALGMVFFWSERRWRGFGQRAALHIGVVSWSLGVETPRLYKAAD